MQWIWKCGFVFCLLYLTGAHVESQQEPRNDVNSCQNEEEAYEQVTISATNNSGEYLRKTEKLQDNEKAEVEAEVYAILARELTPDKIQMTLNASTSRELKELGDMDAEKVEMQDLSIAFPHYRTLCPHMWYLIRRYSWYWKFWYVTNGVIYREYCFTYWWVWATYCPLRYCDVNYSPFGMQWDARYRCFPEYRAIWLPMTCFKIMIKGGQVLPTPAWSKVKWRRVYVPRGCCCRRYWWWIKKLDDICPAYTSGSSETSGYAK